jgi:hypothetical protein
MYVTNFEVTIEQNSNNNLKPSRTNVIRFEPVSDQPGRAQSHDWPGN